MLEAEAGQVLEQTAAQVVHHALTGIDLYLRAVRRHELIDDLQHHARDDDADEEHERMAEDSGRYPSLDDRWERPAAEHVIDHDRQRPRLKRAESDFRRQQNCEERHTHAVRPEKRQRPRQKRLRACRGDEGIAHPVTRLAGAAGGRGGGTRFGAIFGMKNDTILS